MTENSFITREKAVPIQLSSNVNFCWAKKKNGVMMNPAQRLGLTNRQYTEKDIIYFI